MKKKLTIVLVLFTTLSLVAQKKETIKGSKIISSKIREINEFNLIDIADNVEVFLEKGEKPSIKIEADDNLHEIILTNLNEKTLEIKTTKNITNAKSKIIWITYTNDLKAINIKNEAILNAVNPLEINDLSINSFNESNLFLNLNIKNFTLKLADKSQAELNIKSDETNIILENNAKLKALINTINLKMNLSQKSNTIIEGDVANANLKLIENAELDSRKTIIKLININTDGYSLARIFANTGIIISAIKKSEIQLLGTPKIEIQNFADEAKLLKKLK